ncbi:hypothetical protein RYX36_031239 [Vicia faba]
MGPKLFGRKKQKTYAGVGSSQGPRVVQFNRERLVGPKQVKMYQKLEQRRVWTEIFVRILHDGTYKSYWIIFHDRNWDKLCEPESKLNLENVREFYANALPSDDGRFEFKTYVREGKSLDVARLISNKLKKVSLSGTSMGDQTPCQLTFPGSIMGLCKRARVSIPSVGHQVIEGIIDDNYIDRFCMLKDGTAATTVVPVVATPLSSSEYSWVMHEAHQRGDNVALRHWRQAQWTKEVVAQHIFRVMGNKPRCGGAGQRLKSHAEAEAATAMSV